MLSEAQLARLGTLGDERSAPVGEVLYRIGDPTYPFIAILEGEVAIIDAAGTEILRHGQAGFLGEMNLLTGQTVFLTAVVTEPLRYIAVEREALRALLFEDGPLSDLVLATLMQRREALQQVEGVGLEIVGPDSSEATMRMLDFARSNHIPYTWDNTRRPAKASFPSSGCRAAASCGGRRSGRSRARSGSGASSRHARRSTWWSSAAARPASVPRCTEPPRGSRRSSSRAPRSAARRAPRGGSRTTSASRRESPARS